MGTATYVKICCPRCGEKDLNIIGDRDIGGAVASGMGVSVFAGTLSLIHISERTRLGMISYAVVC